MGPVPRPRGEPQGPPQRLDLGLPQLPAGGFGVQPDAGRASTLGWSLAGGADDCVSGALPGLPAGTTGRHRSSTGAAVSGVCGAQPAHVGEPGPARPGPAAMSPGRVRRQRRTPGWGRPRYACQMAAGRPMPGVCDDGSREAGPSAPTDHRMRRRESASGGASPRRRRHRAPHPQLADTLLHHGALPSTMSGAVRPPMEVLFQTPSPRGFAFNRLATGYARLRLWGAERPYHGRPACL